MSIFETRPVRYLQRTGLFFVLFFAHSAYSYDFDVSGFLNFSVASRSQDSAFERQTLPDQSNKNHLNNRQAIGNDSQIFLKASDKLSNGVEYGVTAKGEMNFNSDRRNENPNLDQLFTFSEGDFGKVEFGNNKAVNQRMKAGPASFARGSGGINGKYLENVNLPMLSGGSNASHFILLAQSPIGHGGYAKSFYRPDSNNQSGFNRSQFRAFKDDSFEGMEDATKISYLSPEFSGFKLGASYAPDSSNIGLTKQTAKDVDLTHIKNIFSVGAKYTNDFDNLGVELSATAERGSVSTNQRSDLFAYDFGGSLSYFGFTLGASYGSWGSSMQPTVGTYAKQGKADYYTLGLSYQFGPIAASVTSLNSSFQNNKYSATSFGLDYKLTKNLMPYFEVTNFAFSSASSGVKDNRGYVMLLGALYSF